MLYEVVKGLIGPAARAVYRPDVQGLENIPVDGPVILASNHLSFIDSMVIPIVVPRRIPFLAKAEYFKGTGMKGRIMRWFFTGIGMVPVERSNARASLAALEVLEGVLNGGGAVAIYPEGTRSLDGKLYKGRIGVARLALKTGAPVVPVALTGTDRVQPVGRKLPRIRKIHVRFGAPMDFSQYQGVKASAAIYRTITDQVMYAILEQSGQVYVDEYHERPKAA